MKFVTRFRLLPMLMAVVVACCLGSRAEAQIGWFDDFDDGDAEDGDPVTWTPESFAPGDYDASSGDYVFTGIDVLEGEFLFATVNDTEFSDTSVRTRTVVDDRSADPDNTTAGDVGVIARYDPADVSGYVAVLDDNAFLTVFRTDLGERSWDFFTESDTGFSSDEDVMIQLDVTGTGTSILLEVTLWDPDEPMPLTPQYSRFDESGITGVNPIESGPAGVIFVETINESSGVFRFAQAADTKIVDSLFDEADFDRDGDVDGDDFLLWQTGFGTPSGATKMDGDYDNDEDVDGDDFLGWQDEFGNGSGAGSAAVPEPAGAALAAVLALVAGLGLRRRSA